MTTSVDILFKELPASSPASDRTSRPDTSRVGSDYNRDRSSVSKPNDDHGYEKPFSEHLDDHDVNAKTPDYTKTENQSGYSNGDDQKSDNDDQINENAVQVREANIPVGDTKPAPDKVAQSPENETKPTAEADGKNLTPVIAVRAEDTVDAPKKAVQSVATKDLSIADIVPKKSVPSVVGNSAPKNSEIDKTIVGDAKATEVSPIKTLVTDGVERSQTGENQSGIKELQNAVPNNAESAKQHSPVIVSASTSVPTAPETTPQTAPQTAPQAQTHDQSTPNANDQATIVPVKNTAEGIDTTQPATPTVPEGKIAETIADSSNKNREINEPPIAMHKAGEVETAPQKSGVIISAMATAMKDVIANAPIMEKPVTPPKVVALESSKTLPFALIQSQINAQKTSSSNKKGGSSTAPTANIKTPNISAAGTANTQSSITTPTLLNVTKSDIQLDLGMAGQKFDTILPQVTAPNGQTAMSTGGLLAAQDVSFQKTVSNLGAAMKTDTPLNAKMINEQITVAINKNVVKGLNNFSIRLHPAELGQVDVRLEFMADGRMQAAMTVENEKTLTMLQRDQGLLEKALQDAGISLSNKNMNFSLMKQGGQNNGQKFAGFNDSADNENIQSEMSNMASMQEVRMGYSNQTIDISV